MLNFFLNQICLIITDTFLKKLDHKVNKGMDDKFTKTTHDSEKLKRELKLGFENVQESIVALQKVVDGKIRLSEDKLEKELDKIRKMVVLM